MEIQKQYRSKYNCNAKENTNEIQMQYQRNTNVMDIAIQSNYKANTNENTSEIRMGIHEMRWKCKRNTFVITKEIQKHTHMECNK